MLAATTTTIDTRIYKRDFSRSYHDVQLAFLDAHAEACKLEAVIDSDGVTDWDTFEVDYFAAVDAEHAAADALIDWAVEICKGYLPGMWQQHQEDLSRVLALRQRADVRHDLIQIALKYAG